MPEPAEKQIQRLGPVSFVSQSDNVMRGAAMDCLKIPGFDDLHIPDRVFPRKLETLLGAAFESR
jgi:hypothetical protein